MRLRISAGALAIAVAMMWLTAKTTADQQAGGASTAKPAAAAASESRAPSRTKRRGRRTASPISAASGATPPTRRSSATQNVTKEFYTPEEFQEGDEADAQASDEEQTTPGTTADVHYDFTQFGLDKSQHTIAQNLRTSQIIDPPDGRLPPTVTEAGEAARGRPPRRSASRQARRPVRPGAEHAERLALHHHGRRRSSAARRRLQQHATTSCRVRGT